MRGVLIKRPLFILGGMGLIFYLRMFLQNGYEHKLETHQEMDTSRMIRSFSDLQASISNLNNVLRSFEQKQDAMQKMLEEDRARQRKAAKVQQPAVLKQPEKQKEDDANIQPQKEAAQKKESGKLFPKSALFKEWGINLSEDDQREAQSLFEKYGYNVFLSDRLPLDRPLPDTRDPRCLKKSYPKDLPSLGVVLIYLNEALSILKRALRSIIDRTPKNLLKEIIMVDDNSSNDDLKADLDMYVKSLEQENPNLSFVRVRHSEQRGLAYARASGWRAATADVVAILDAHIEVHEMWAEPLLTQIKADRTVVVSPMFDRVNYDDLKVIQYPPATHAFNWALWCTYERFSPDYYNLNDSSLPGKSPSIMGVLVADRRFLGEIGVLDEGMKVYGGENVELAIRVKLEQV
ncbi:probable polypeptide N-acetylgalactosaminyltransferase 8 [Archocentrus centrarchus]|uniref:probable polypeptide N-acetylgalactosaminyltransferase 8 n=1 Tax=Archocentrus centrarchus TaxID=63155 RepID=UPI0011E9FDE9|nr:probable polypeptide N-acetylgalactosaminyltransferase 8 [Archocentrus centrarchus]